MLKIILAHALAFPVAIAIGGLAGLVPTLLFSSVNKAAPKNTKFILSNIDGLITGIITGISVIFVATFIFNKFGLKLSVIMVALLALGILHNNYRRIIRTERQFLHMELMSASGEILGLVAGLLIFH